MHRWNCSLAGLLSLSLLALPDVAARAADPTQLVSPDAAVQVTIAARDGHLTCAARVRGKPVLENSRLHLALDGADLADGVELGKVERFQIDETYPWRGVHSQARNHCHGARIAIRHAATQTDYTLEFRVFDDGVAFCYHIPGGQKPRVPDETTTFVMPAGSTVWYHDLEGHYEGVHVKKAITEIKAGEWAAPPLTFKLPDGGYASITEAALVNYSGMALQADGHGGFTMRLGHVHPPSYPFRLRYGLEEAERLAKPAALKGPIITPWRVVLIGADLNALVNSDVVSNLCPPPDRTLFPKGLDTDWIRPGRAVWKYLDGGQNTLADMKEYCRLAEELGFEHNILEGFWARWTDAEMLDLANYAKQHHVGIWLWKHSKSLRDPQARHEFWKRCNDYGVVGAKIDFFDHEAKEVIDFYQTLLREAAEHKLMLDFHGANKPTGEGRTWPNELTREAIKGMEASKLTNRATHDVTLPFTRLLAGPAEYTPVHFGERRRNTTWAHQVASAAIFSAPLLTYAAHPANLLANPAREMFKSIPPTWDETRVLPPSEIGEVAVYARRKGATWFLAVMNGTSAKAFRVPLSFLDDGRYAAMVVRDVKDNAAAVELENTMVTRDGSVAMELSEGGGFIARFTKD